MKHTDRRNKLSESPFRFHIAKSRRILIHWENKLIKTLSEKESAKFIARIGCKSDYEVQLELAKITGHFKHGNESTNQF